MKIFTSKVVLCLEASDIMLLSSAGDGVIDMQSFWCSVNYLNMYFFYKQITKLKREKLNAVESALYEPP